MLLPGDERCVGVSSRLMIQPLPVRVTEMFRPPTTCMLLHQSMISLNRFTSPGGPRLTRAILRGVMAASGSGDDGDGNDDADTVMERDSVGAEEDGADVAGELGGAVALEDDAAGDVDGAAVLVSGALEVGALGAGEVLGAGALGVCDALDGDVGAGVESAISARDLAINPCD